MGMDLRRQRKRARTASHTAWRPPAEIAPATALDATARLHGARRKAATPWRGRWTIECGDWRAVGPRGQSYPLASTCRAASLLQLTVEAAPLALPHTRRGTNASLRSLASFSVTVARPSRRRSWARQHFVGTCKEACLPRSRLRTTQPHPKNLLPIARNCEKRTSHPCPPPQTF